MKLNLCNVLDREGQSEMITHEIDFSTFCYRGMSPFREPIRMMAKAINRAGIITLECAYWYTLYIACDCCLCSITRQINQHSTHTVVRSLQNKEEDDYLVVPEGIVILEEVATGDILLEFPAKFLCRDDCQGLCPVCGCDRNYVRCGCVATAPDPRLEALNSFFDQTEE